MSTRITDFHQPSTVTVQSLETGGAGVASSFGAANCLRLRSDATMWSTGGAQLSLKSLGANSLLLAKEVRINLPVEMRWVNHAGDVIIPNMYSDAFGSNVSSGNGQALNIDTDTKCKVQDSISIRPLGFLRSIQSMLITLNGTSFQVRPDEFIDAYEALYLNNRFDMWGATASPPFNNCGASNPRSEPGRFQRCLNMQENGNIKYVGHNANDHELEDAVFEYTLTTKLPLAFFIYSVFPSLENLTGNSLDSAAHITDLSVEFSFKNECPLIHWFSCVNTDLQNAQSVDITSLAVHAANNTGQRLQIDGLSGVDCQRMWNSAVSREATIGNATDKANGIYVNVKRSYLSYVMVEPDISKTPLLSAYTMPGLNFISYSKEVAIPGDKRTENVSFDYIKVDKLAPLITLTVCESEKDGINNAVGGRSARWKGGVHLRLRRGMGYTGCFGRIKLDTLKINLSIRNQVLGSLDGSKCTEYDFYRIFLKYSKSKMSFTDWQKYMSGMICFSPMELCGVGFAGAYAPYTMSISFEFERCFADTHEQSRNWAKTSNAGGIILENGIPKRWFGRNQNYRVNLCFLQESLITLSPGACGVEYPRFSQQEAAQQFSSAQVRLDEGVLDQFVNAAQ